MITHEQLLEEWKADSTIDQTRLMPTMYNHPVLHSKYLTYLMGYKLQLRKLLMKYQKQKVFKQRYYNGELTREELNSAGLQQYLFKKPLKSEMESLLDADSDLQLIQEQSLYVESLIYSCESILKDISNRYYLFKNLVEYEKFQSGV